MEVHAHTHTERKKFTHYLWEFLMLFLAVFCGFLAENFREHEVERRREKQFINSMIDDVRLDTAALHIILQRRVKRREMFDSLSLLLNSPEQNKNLVLLYYFARHIPRLSPVNFTYNDRTIQQLKNGGNMRLIRNETVTNAIVLYDASVRDMDITEGRENDYMVACLPLMYRIFDGRIMDLMLDSTGAIHTTPPGNMLALLPTETANLPDFNGAFHSLKSSNLVILTKIKSLIAVGEKLMKTMKEEYHLSEGIPLEK